MDVPNNLQKCLNCSQATLNWIMWAKRQLLVSYLNSVVFCSLLLTSIIHWGSLWEVKTGIYKWSWQDLCLELSWQVPCSIIGGCFCFSHLANWMAVAKCEFTMQHGAKQTSEQCENSTFGGLKCILNTWWWYRTSTDIHYAVCLSPWLRKSKCFWGCQLIFKGIWMNSQTTNKLSTLIGKFH